MAGHGQYNCGGEAATICDAIFGRFYGWAGGRGVFNQGKMLHMVIHILVGSRMIAPSCLAENKFIY